MIFLFFNTSASMSSADSPHKMARVLPHTLPEEVEGVCDSIFPSPWVLMHGVAGRNNTKNNEVNYIIGQETSSMDNKSMFYIQNAQYQFLLQ